MEWLNRFVNHILTATALHRQVPSILTVLFNLSSWLPSGTAGSDVYLEDLTSQRRFLKYLSMTQTSVCIADEPICGPTDLEHENQSIHECDLDIWHLK